MNMPLLKAERAAALPVVGAGAEVVRLKAKKPGFLRARVLPAMSMTAARIVPPLVTLALLLIVWQILCNRPRATLPAPTNICSEARDLITEPFFVTGPQDIGRGRRVLSSAP